MDSDDFIACIGKPQDAPEVQRMLQAVGVTKTLRMPRDDIEARVDLGKDGLSLIFKPEDPKSSLLVFNAVQFISDAEKGFTSFAGTLPRQLLFSDTQAQAHAKLGKPFDARPKLRRDIWKLDGLRLAIKYAKDDGRIAIVTVHLPLQE